MKVCKCESVGFTILQIHLELQLDPTYSRGENLQEDFFSFSGKSAGVKIAEAHSCIELILYGQAGITARIWVGLSNEFNKFGTMFVMLVWVNINYLIMKMK